MKRIATALILMMSLAGMGESVTSEPLPLACDVLQAIDIATTLGPGATLQPTVLQDNESARLSLCSADTPDLSARMSLMVRENLSGDVPDSATLRAQMIDELRDTIGENTVIEELQIGDGAIWAGEIGQLIVWHRGGGVMFIFSPTPSDDSAAAEAAAQKVLTAFP